MEEWRRLIDREVAAGEAYEANEAGAEENERQGLLNDGLGIGDGGREVEAFAGSVYLLDVKFELVESCLEAGEGTEERR